MNNSKIALSILLGLLFFIPLVIFPWAEDSYLIPKFTLLNFGVLLVIFIITIKDKAEIINLKSVIMNRASYILLLFFFLNIISLIYATSVPLALKEIGKWFFLILLYFGFILVIRTGKQLQKIIYTILSAGLVTALWTILQDYHIDFGFRFQVIPRLPDWRGFLVAGLGNSDYVAGFLVSIFPLGFVLYAMVKETKQKIFILVVLSFIYAALIITFSVGANAGLILGIILVFLLGFIEKRNKVRSTKCKVQNFVLSRWFWLILIFGLITAFYVLPIPFNGRGESIFSQAFASNRWKEGGNTRLVIWANTWELIKTNPILGTGAGNFTYKYLDYTALQVIANPRMKIYSGEYTNAAHNEFLHTWSELGIFGVIILLLLIGSFYLSARKIILEKSQILNLKSEIGESLPTVLLGATGGFTAMLVYGMMSYPLHLPATAMLFIIYIALPKIIANIENDELKQKSEISNLKSKIIKPSLATVYRLLSTILFLLLAFWSVRPLVADSYFHFGKQALKQENEPTALTAFMNATRWDNQADTHYHLGELYLRGKEFGGRIPEAITEFESARKQRNDKYLLYELGIAYQMAERYQDALSCFKPLTQRQPDNPEYWERLSFIYLKLGKSDLSHQAHLKSEQLKKQF